MISYEIYNVTFVGKKPKESLSSEEVYKIVTKNGDWDVTECFENESIAWHMWRNKWSDMAETIEDEDDDDFLRYSIYIFERSERNDDTEEIENSVQLEYSAESFNEM